MNERRDRSTLQIPLLGIRYASVHACAAYYYLLGFLLQVRWACAIWLSSYRQNVKRMLLECTHVSLRATRAVGEDIFKICISGQVAAEHREKHSSLQAGLIILLHCSVLRCQMWLVMHDYGSDSHYFVLNLCLFVYGVWAEAELGADKHVRLT